MSVKSTNNEPLHTLPEDMHAVLAESAKLMEKWNTLTPLAQNEWICWVTIVKKPETRADHVRRFQEEVLGGKKRPCCWPGCPHRNEAARKWFSR